MVEESIGNKWVNEDAQRMFSWSNNVRIYDKIPKIPYTKVADKLAYANSVDPYQTAPEGAV